MQPLVHADNLGDEVLEVPGDDANSVSRLQRCAHLLPVAAAVRAGVGGEEHGSERVLVHISLPSFSSSSSSSAAAAAAVEPAAAAALGEGLHLVNARRRVGKVGFESVGRKGLDGKAVEGLGDRGPGTGTGGGGREVEREGA